MPRFLRRMRGHWWARPLSGRSDPSGLQTIVARDEFDASVARFEASFEEDPVAASRELVRSLLDPLARAAGKPTWVEQSTHTVDAAPTLLRLFPEARMIHVLRDGRDIACSLASLPWGPDTALEGLERWERRLRGSDAGARAIPSDRLLVIHLEDLIVADRDGSYARLEAFIGLRGEREMRDYFDRHSTPASANVERWRRDLSPAEQGELTDAYQRALARLAADGVSVATELARRAGVAVPAAD